MATFCYTYDIEKRELNLLFSYIRVKKLRPTKDSTVYTIKDSIITQEKINIVYSNYDKTYFTGLADSVQLIDRYTNSIYLGRKAQAKLTCVKVRRRVSSYHHLSRLSLLICQRMNCLWTWLESISTIWKSNSRIITNCMIINQISMHFGGVFRTKFH